MLFRSISVPNEHTAKVQRVITGRRGQILGYDAKPGWKGWDEVSAHMPQSEIHDLIIELRSLTLGVATYTWKFDHLAELTGRLADKVIEEQGGRYSARFNHLKFEGAMQKDGLHLACNDRGKACGELVVQEIGRAHV